MIPGELPELRFDWRLRRKRGSVSGVHFVNGVTQLSQSKTIDLSHGEESLPGLRVPFAKVRCGRLHFLGKINSRWRLGWRLILPFWSWFDSPTNLISQIFLQVQQRMPGPIDVEVVH